MSAEPTTLGLSADAWELIDVFVGLALVLFGVIFEGESFNDRTLCGRSVNRLGHKMVVYGLAVELLCAPIVWSLNRERSALLDLEAERERTARTELGQRVAARHLDPDMVLTSVSRIEPRGSRTANIVVSRDDMEAIALAAQIRSLVEFSGWTVTRQVYGREAGMIRTGVCVEISSAAWQTAWDAGNALVVSLKKDHGVGSIGPFAMGPWKIEGQPDALDPEAEVKIIVGSKPLFFPKADEVSDNTPKPTTSDRKTDH